MSRTITVTEKHKAVKKGLMAESEFTRQMRQLYPMYISQFNGFKDAVQILKNKGMLFEEKQDDINNHLFSPEALQRGINCELDKKGIDSSGANIDSKEIEKATIKAIKNLKKDVLYYLNILSGESSKVDKHDKYVETKRGAKDKDTFNGLKKADLNEGAVKNKIYAYAERIFNDYLKARQSGAQIDFQDMLNSINADDATNMGMDYKFYKNNQDNILNAMNNMNKPSNVRLKAILKRGIETIKAKYPSVHVDDILDFIKTHRNDVLGGVDIADEFEEYADANDILVKEPKGGLDKEAGIGAMSVKDIEAMPNEKDPLTGKNVVMFKEQEKIKKYQVGDTWSEDFDYDGMLNAGLKVRINTPIDQLKKLYSSFEDVNYHHENRELAITIDALEAGDKSAALEGIKNFKKEIRLTIAGLSKNENRERTNEAEGDDHHYIKVTKPEFKKADEIIARNIDGNHVKVDYVDNDGAGNVVIYFIFKDGDIASGKADTFIHDVVMDLGAFDIDVVDHSANIDNESDEEDGYNTDPNLTMHIDDEEWEREMGRGDEVQEEKEVEYYPETFIELATNYIKQRYDGRKLGKMTTTQLEVIGKKLVDQKYDGDVSKALQDMKDRIIREEKEVKAAVKIIIKEILSEAYTGRLQGYVDSGQEGTAEAAKELMGVLEALENDFLKHKDKISAAYEKAGPGMAPALGNAFLKDLTNQRLSYDKIEMPKFHRLSPDEKAAIDAVSEEEKEIVYSRRK